MDLHRLAQDQRGVLCRRQVLALGGDDNLIERMVRRRLWTPLHPGTYVDHSGVPTAEQRRMAGVLYAWPAALAGESALAAHGLASTETRTVLVAIDSERRVREQPGLAVVRMVGLQGRAQWHRSPPRLRVEDAVLQVASRRCRSGDEPGAVAVLADACQERRTTPARLLIALEQWPHLPGRRLLRDLLGDIDAGARSPLEQRYLTRVERAHGLPPGQRQQPFRSGSRRGYRDVVYAEQGLVVELDGRLGHAWATDRWSDLARDLLATSGGLHTVRVGWEAVAQPCRLARLLGDCLRSLGWTGSLRPCRRCGS